MDTDQSVNEYKKKRRALTKWLFLLLFFNAALYLDGVERFFDPTSDHQGRFVAAEMECSSFGDVQLPADPAQFMAGGFFQLGINPNSFELSIDFPVDDRYLPIHWVQRSLVRTDSITIDQQIHWQSSGLSPPA